MLRSLIILCLLVPFAGAQIPYDPAVTNQPVPFSSTVIIPQAAVPSVIVPQATTIDTPALTTPDASSGRVVMPRVQGAFGKSPNGQPPNISDIAHRPLSTRMQPPPLPPVVPLQLLAVSTNSDSAATAAGGHYRFVDPSGSDDHAGNRTSPWKTIQQAADQAQPGDIVIVHSGIYEAFHTVHGGEINRPIIFRAKGDVIIVPQGGDAPKNLALNNPADLYRVDNINIRDCNYVTIDGFQIQRAGRCGIFVENSQGVILRNNIVSASGRFGILTGFAVDLQVVSNKTFGTIAEHGIYVSNSRSTNDNPLIAYNESYNNRRSGIQVNGDCRAGGDGSIDGAHVENNIVHDNGLNGMSLISMSGSVVQNNLVYHNGRDGSGAGGIHLTDESGCNHASSTNVIVNNTIVESDIPCLRLTDAANNNILFNNLLVGRPLLDEVGDNKIDQNSNLMLEKTGGVFAAPDSGDFHLLTTSPARNIGLMEFQRKKAPTEDITGARRVTLMSMDVGAY